MRNGSRNGALPVAAYVLSRLQRVLSRSQQLELPSLPSQVCGQLQPQRRFALSYEFSARRLNVIEKSTAGQQAGFVVRGAELPGGERALVLGGALTLHGYTFLLAEADEATLSWMERSPERFPASDARRAWTKLAPQLQARREPLEKALAFAVADNQIREEGRLLVRSDGRLLAQADFVRVFRQVCGAAAELHEVVTVFRSLTHERQRRGLARLLDAKLLVQALDLEFDQETTATAPY